MIKLENVEKSFGPVRVLKRINLEIGAGEFISVMGSSGSGKSTLLNLIGAMDVPEAGRIIVNGDDLTAFTDEQLTLYRRKKIGFVFQFFNLLPNITVLENIQMPLLLNGIDDEERGREFIRLAGLTGKENAHPYQLSGGQQQRVAIARALIHGPEIILADEPTGSLDSTSSKEIMDLLAGLIRDSGKIAVLVTHEESISRYAQRRVLIKDGVLSS